MLDVSIAKIDDLKNFNGDRIIERIVLDCGNYYIGYSGLTINVYDKSDNMLIFSPSNMIDFRDESYGKITEGLAKTKSFEKCDKALVKAINWIKHTGRCRNIYVPEEVRELFICLSMYYWLKVDDLLNMEKLAESNEYVDKVYNNLMNDELLMIDISKSEEESTHDINKMDGNKLRALIEIYEKSDQRTKEKMNKEYPGLSDII